MKPAGWYASAIYAHGGEVIKMAEYIDKNLAVEELENLRQQYEMHDDCDELVARSCKNAILELPVSVVVSVVRCQECKHFTMWGGKDKAHFCSNKKGLAGIVENNDFCSYGERK